MSRVFLQPCANTIASGHFESTVHDGISWESFKEKFNRCSDEDDQLIEELQQFYTQDDNIKVWGVVSGNSSTFQQMREGDYVVFTNSSYRTRCLARVAYPYNSSFLADQLWEHRSRKKVLDLPVSYTFDDNLRFSVRRIVGEEPVVGIYLDGELLSFKDIPNPIIWEDENVEYRVELSRSDAPDDQYVFALYSYEPWENIYFLYDVTEVVFDNRIINLLAGRVHHNSIQRFEVLSGEIGELIARSLFHNLESVLDIYNKQYLPSLESNDDSDESLDFPYMCSNLHTYIDPNEIQRRARERIDKLRSDGKGHNRRTKSYARREREAFRDFLFKGALVSECEICSQKLPVSLLWAAHIKRRADCNDDEAWDYENNLLKLCKFGCDDLFEHGYIYYDAHGNLKKNLHHSTLSESSDLSNLIDSLVEKSNQRKHDTKERKFYFKHHRNTCSAL